MHCPRCKTPLVELHIDEAGVQAHAWNCGHCGGHFLPKGQLEPLETVTKVALFDFRGIPSDRSQLSPLACPKCGGDDPMMKVKSARDQRVTLDVCPACRGTWLDRGELEAIQTENLVTFLGNIGKWIKGE